MWFFIIIGFLTPPLGAFFIYMWTDSTIIEAIRIFSMWWVFLTPIWAIALLYATYWTGRTIEILDTAKSTINFARANQHHAKNVFQFFKMKVRR